MSVAAVHASAAWPGASRRREACRGGGGGGVGHRRRGGVGDGADVPGRVLRGQLVEVGSRRHAQIREARPGRLCDPVGHGGRESGRRPAVEVVAGDADVVRRGSPRQVHRRARHSRGERRGRSRRRCVGDRRADLRGRGADIAGRVLRGDDVVVGAGPESRVRECGGGRLPDPVPGSRSEAGARASMDVVARHADVVGRGHPAEVDRASRHGAGEARRRARRGRVGRDGCARLVRRRPDVAGRVFRRHPVEVRTCGRGVGVARRRRLRDPVPGGGREPGRRATVDVVAGDGDVVGGRSPRKRGAADCAGGGQRPGSSGRRRIAHRRPTLRSRPRSRCRPRPRRSPCSSRCLRRPRPCTRCPWAARSGSRPRA